MARSCSAGTWSWRVRRTSGCAARNAYRSGKSLGKKGEWTLGEHTLRLTNLDKVLFPAKRGRGGAKALTKRDLIRHHAVMAPYLLPHLADRPVNLHRFPDGTSKPGFWHKAAPAYAPDWMTRWRNPHADPGETEVDQADDRLEQAGAAVGRICHRFDSLFRR